MTQAVVHAATTADRRAMTPGVVVMALTLLLGVQPVATDLYLPALPSIASDLGTTMSATQLTLSALAIAFGIGQLVCGALSDRYGRRPVLLVGLVLFTAASVAATLAPDIAWLVAMRAMQGAALAAAVTCARSVIRDLFEPHEGARVMSRALTGLGFIAIAAPIVGSVTVATIGWRASLASTAVFSTCTLAFCIFKFRETAAVLNPLATRPRPLVRSWLAIVRNPTFSAYTLLSMSTYAGLFLVLVGSSFAYIDVLGLGKIEYGAMMTVNSIAYTAGTALCRRLLARRGLRGTVAVAAVMSLVGGLGMFAVVLAGVPSPWLLAAPQWLYAVAHGVHQPCGQAGAIGPFPRAAGTASALSGFLMMSTAFVCGLVYSRVASGTVVPLAVGCAIAGVLVATVAWTLVQRHGEPRPVPVVVPEPA